MIPIVRKWDENGRAIVEFVDADGRNSEIYELRRTNERLMKRVAELEALQSKGPK